MAARERKDRKNKGRNLIVAFNQVQSAAAFPWWIFIIFIAAAHKRRRQKMGPRLQIKPEEFIAMAKSSNNLVIRSSKSWLSPFQYVIREGDYYYYTVSKQPLDLPSSCPLKEVKSIL